MKTKNNSILGAALLVVCSLSAAAAGIITTCTGGGTNGNFSNTIGFPATDLAPNSWLPAGSPIYLPAGTVRLDISPTNPARFYRVKAQ